ncbi:MAG: gamma-glutamylcyclotransferase [Thermoplasmata archaeon]
MPWIFGYGSLMWDPFFPYLRWERAVLPGYHRAFVMSFGRVWGSPGAPCVVLGLEIGGSCDGVAYEIEEGRKPEIEEELHSFEGEAFEIKTRTVRLAEEEIEAMVALNRPSHPDYLGHIPESERIGMVLRAQGPQESCLSYARRTAEALERLGILDRGVVRFVHQLEQARR